MLFTFAVPSLLLLAAVNGAVLPQKRDDHLERRDFLDDIGGILENLPAELPGIISAVESLLGGAAEPTPTDDDVGFSLPAPTLTAVASGVPSGLVPTPVPAATSLGPASAVPFPSMSLYDPENPAGIRLPGTPFTVTAPPAASATISAISAPARRSRLNMRNDQIEKRINIDNIVNAVVSALPSGIQQEVAPLVHNLIDGAAPTSSSTPSAVNNDVAQPSDKSQSSPSPSSSANSAARSLQGSSSVTLMGSVVVVVSIVFGAVVAL